MTLKEENLPELERRLNDSAGLTKEDFCPELWVDAPLPVQYISEKLIAELELLEPFGVGNPKPVFAEQHFHVLTASRRGKNRNALIMKVANATGHSVDAVYFGNIDIFEEFICENWSEEELEKMYAGEPNEIDVGFAYYPSVNEYNGRRKIQIVVTDYCRINR